MNINFINYLLIFLLLVSASLLKANSVRVGVVEGPPFAMVDNGMPRGIAVDLWEEIARQGNIQYKFVKFSPKADDMLDLLYNHQLDLVIGPISVTSSRIQKLDFTVSYFNNKVGIVIQKNKNFLWEAFVSLIHSSFILMALLLIFSFLTYVSVFWVFEREKNQDLPEKYMHAISYSFWSHLFHKQYVFFPQTIWGKLAALMWVIFPTFLLASLTASLTSYYLTVIQNESGIKNIDELHNKTLAAIQGRHDYEVAKNVSSSVISVKDVQEALDMIKAGKVFGLVYDHYTAQYELDHRKDTSSLMVPNIVLDHQPFAFAIRYGDPLRVKINRIIMQLNAENIGIGMCTPYLGKDSGECEF